MKNETITFIEDSDCWACGSSDGDGKKLDCGHWVEVEFNVNGKSICFDCWKKDLNNLVNGELK